MSKVVEKYREILCVTMSLASLIVNQLKDKLRETGLSSSGTKSELIARLLGANLPSEILEAINVQENQDDNNSETLEAQENQDDNNLECSAITSLYKRELKVSQREKKVAEYELQLARKEIDHETRAASTRNSSG